MLVRAMESCIMGVYARVIVEKLFLTWDSLLHLKKVLSFDMSLLWIESVRYLWPGPIRLLRRGLSCSKACRRLRVVSFLSQLLKMQPSSSLSTSSSSMLGFFIMVLRTGMYVFASGMWNMCLPTLQKSMVSSRASTSVKFCLSRSAPYTL